MSQWRRPSWLAIVLCGLLFVAFTGLASWAYRWRMAHEIKQLTATCEVARKSGNWDQLEHLAQRLKQIEPTSGQPLLYLAESAQMKGQLEQAVAFLGQFPEHDLRAPQVLAEKANLEWGELNRPFDALQTCEDLIHLRPTTTYAHARIISFYTMTLQRSKMLMSIRRAIKLRAEPREVYAYAIMADAPTFVNGSTLNARWQLSASESSVFDIAFAIFTAISRQEQVDEQLTSTREEAAQKARAGVEELHARFPHNSVLLGFLLSKNIEEGNVDRVEELLKLISFETEADYLLWIYRGWFQTLRRELDAAEISFRRALELHPLSWQARHEYAVLFRKKQRLDLAEEMGNLAMEGREIRKELLALPNAREIPDETLQRIAKYAEKCGDTDVAEALHRRLTPVQEPRQPLSENTERSLGLGR